MSRILYAWEFGNDLGHILPFLPVAMELRRRGHDVVWALRDLARAESVLGKHDFELLQSPVWLPNIEGLPEPIYSYPEMLFRYGYLESSGLLGQAYAWRELLKVTDPDLLIADYAPTALIAARAAGTPVVMIGTGFCSPPRGQPLPTFLPWLNPPLQRLLSAERRVLDTVNQVLAKLGSAPLERLADLFSIQENFLTTYTELDHYDNRPGAKYWGSISGVDQGIEPDWPEGSVMRIFAYLKSGFPSLPETLEALAKTERPTLVYCAGSSANLRNKFATGSLHVSENPFNIQRALVDCGVVVCHAGHGTVCSSLLAGKPLLLLPTTVEQGLLARRVEQLGAGLIVLPRDNHTAPGDALKRLLEETSFARSARSFAEKHSKRSDARTVQAIVDRCDEVIHKGREAAGTTFKRDRFVGPSLDSPLASIGPTAGVLPSVKSGHRILFVWELGGDLGHMHAALPLACELRQRGHQVHFALRDLSQAAPVLGEYGFGLLQAPVWLAATVGHREIAVNYAEILLQNGYLAASGLLGLIAAWHALFKEAKPELIIADHAPTALLAARKLAIPCALRGTGFSIPPAVDSMPTIVPWLNPPGERVLASERHALTVANQALQQLGLSPLARLADLFKVDESFLMTYSELDHYPDRKGTRYWGITQIDTRGDAPAWPLREGKRAFAYLKMRHPRFEEILALLRHAQLNTLVYCPGMPAPLRAKHTSDRLRFNSNSYNIRDIVGTCDIVICHAGHGTTCHALLGGKPVLLLPLVVEQMLLSNRVEHLGAGVGLHPDMPAQDVHQALVRVAHDDSFTLRAKHFSQKYASVNPQAVVAEMVSRCEELMQVHHSQIPT